MQSRMSFKLTAGAIIGTALVGALGLSFLYTAAGGVFGAFLGFITHQQRPDHLD